MKSTMLLESLAVAAVWMARLAASGPLAAPVGTRAAEAVDFNAPATHYLPMRRVATTPGKMPLASAEVLRSSRAGDGVPPLPGTHLRNMNDIYFVVDISVGREVVPVHVDTGSSDTWIVQQPFHCLRENPYGFDYVDAPMDFCGFGRGFDGNLSQGLLADQTFAISYGDGTFARGYYGFEDVSIAGLTAHHQQLAVVNVTFWRSDGHASGLLGLAYPLMTSPDNETLQYDPLFTTI